jgi:hypothetical protein
MMIGTVTESKNLKKRNKTKQKPSTGRNPRKFDFCAPSWLIGVFDFIAMA